MTQKHSDQQDMPGLKIAHGFMAEMHLQQALNKL